MYDEDKTDQPEWTLNQSTDSTSGRLSLSVGWENGPEWGLKTVSFNLNFL